MALLYGVFLLKEVPPKPKDPNQSIVAKSFCADFFDVSHIKDTFMVAFHSDDKRRRIKILVLMAVVIIVVGPQHGEMSLFYLFTRYKFNWSEVEFSFFSTYSMGIHLIGKWTLDYVICYESKTCESIGLLFQEPVFRLVYFQAYWKSMMLLLVRCRVFRKFCPVLCTHLRNSNGKCTSAQ